VPEIWRNGAKEPPMPFPAKLTKNSTIQIPEFGAKKGSNPDDLHTRKFIKILPNEACIKQMLSITLRNLKFQK
jgi:hypothetical protein